MEHFGLFFGWQGIIAVGVMAFGIGAIASILLIAFRIKKVNDYIPFGPFIVISSLVAIFIPFVTIFDALTRILTLGLI